MNAQQRHALTLRETDVQGALHRFGGNEAFYASCLAAFLEDTTMAELNAAIRSNSWDEAFTAAHALKGLAGNMGFVPLMHSLSQLVVLIRGGRIRELDRAMSQVNSSYRDITDAIRQSFILTNEENQDESR